MRGGFIQPLAFPRQPLAGARFVFTWVWTPAHYIHLMLVTLLATISVALAGNRAVLMRSTANAVPDYRTSFPERGIAGNPL